VELKRGIDVEVDALDKPQRKNPITGDHVTTLGD
jgi:hypothetical protein